jgi:hypothetical protein
MAARKDQGQNPEFQRGMSFIIPGDMEDHREFGFAGLASFPGEGQRRKIVLTVAWWLLGYAPDAVSIGTMFWALT